MSEIKISELTENEEFDFGFTSLSEKEIMDFAHAYDPLDFHIDKDVAEKSVFGTLVASGPHIFNWFYKNRWVPVFNKTVMAGLELNNWRLKKPVYPGKAIHCTAKILSIKKNELKNYATIIWKFFLTDEFQEPVQTLEMTVLHRLT